ncbi:Sterol O-acyltransferase 2 (Sterol-ester synthase 2) [Neonectria magnoliae]|uniref:Sterol O-acyltransferase 2 (Sterol-ester synthase 2) n=1 Tax=Neonectria magnoliae TaxID=2732573 RepID=A0ABR1I7V7_9HYPO
MASSRDSGVAPLSGPGGTGSDPVPPPARHPGPRSLADALHAAGMTLDGSTAGSDTPSEEDYDENVRPKLGEPQVLRRRPGRSTNSPASARLSASLAEDFAVKTTPQVHVRRDSGVHIVPDEDKSLQQLLQASSQRAREPSPRRRQGKFADLVFTRQFSAFDRQNTSSVNSPFHGFYTLFWLAVALFVFQISGNNWRVYGNPFGTNDIMKTMFRRDVIVLLLSDGIMCGLTGVSWLIQLLVLNGYLNWDRTGWVVQHLWQTSFFVGVIGLTLWRDWPWTHTVFFVLHGIVMLMKQHSYAFYNGYLSTVLAKRSALLTKLKQLDLVHPATAPSQTDPPVSAISTQHLKIPPSAEQRRKSISQLHHDEESDLDRISRAIASGQPLDDQQIGLFERIMKWEVDALTDELKGTSNHPSRAYPNNLTFINHYKWIPLPTLVYELEYPQSNSISWPYVAEKLTAMIGVLFVMVQTRS